MLFICEHRDVEGEEDCKEEATFGHVDEENELTPMCHAHKCDECKPLAEALLKQTRARYGGYDLLVGFKDGRPYILVDEQDGETGRVSREYFSARLDLEFSHLAFLEAKENERKNRRSAADQKARLPVFVPADLDTVKRKH